MAEITYWILRKPVFRWGVLRGHNYFHFGASHDHTSYPKYAMRWFTYEAALDYAAQLGDKWTPFEWKVNGAEPAFVPQTP